MALLVIEGQLVHSSVFDHWVPVKSTGCWPDVWQRVDDENSARMADTASGNEPDTKA